MKSNQKRRERGAAMIEAALTISLFMTIMFTLFDLGFDLWQYQTLVSRARIAIRYGATNPTDTAGMQNLVLYGQTTAGQYPLFGMGTSNVTVTRTGSGTNADRLTIGITGFSYTRVTMGYAGKTNGLPVTVGIAVEPNY